MQSILKRIDPPHFTAVSHDPRLRVVLADASPQYMKVVSVLLEFHEIVDLIGRAATFEETIHLAVNHQPDVILLDLDMPLADLALATITLATHDPVKIVGMCGAGTILQPPFDAPKAIDAVIDKSRLRRVCAALASAWRSDSSIRSPSTAFEGEITHCWQILQFPKSAH